MQTSSSYSAWANPGKMVKVEQIEFQPLNWLPDASIFNKNMQKIDPEWIAANADIVALLFTAKGVEKDGIVHKFYKIYENVKFVNLPIEVSRVLHVINVIILSNSKHFLTVLRKDP